MEIGNLLKADFRTAHFYTMRFHLSFLNCEIYKIFSESKRRG